MKDDTPLLTARPSKLLQPFISHYWLGLNNRDSVYAVLPDGAVDVVVDCGGGAADGRVYGSATVRTDIALDIGHHYLGVRFKPGHSRHFMHAAAAELTDRSEPADGLLRFDIAALADYVGSPAVFPRLDALLTEFMQRRPPRPERIDTAIARLDTSHGTASMADLAETFGRCRRQFERVFRDTVGVSPKYFACVRRFRRAVELIESTAMSLADIAVTAGYADQSHMNRDFRRLAGVSPGACVRRHVAFVQDTSFEVPETGAL